MIGSRKIDFSPRHSRFGRWLWLNAWIVKRKSYECSDCGKQLQVGTSATGADTLGIILCEACARAALTELEDK